MRSHVRKLARLHRIKLEAADAGSERAYFDTRTAHIQPVSGPATYLAALHELAHIIHKPAVYPNARKSRAAYRKGVLAAEVAAWTWAVRNSAVPIPHWMFQRIATCLAEYKGNTGAKS